MPGSAAPYSDDCRNAAGSGDGGGDQPERHGDAGDLVTVRVCTSRGGGYYD
jgi:hypothetical protein